MHLIYSRYSQHFSIEAHLMSRPTHTESYVLSDLGQCCLLWQLSSRLAKLHQCAKRTPGNEILLMKPWFPFETVSLHHIFSAQASGFPSGLVHVIMTGCQRAVGLCNLVSGSGSIPSHGRILFPTSTVGSGAAKPFKMDSNNRQNWNKMQWGRNLVLASQQTMTMNMWRPNTFHLVANTKTLH